MTHLIPGYDKNAVTLEDWREFREEAERRGHVYELFIDGVPLTKNGEGILYMAKSDDEAIRSAYHRAWSRSCDLDGIDWLRTKIYHPTHPYKLYHQGEQIVDYVPPNLEDVKCGKVVMLKATEVMAPYRSDWMAPHRSN